MQNIIPSHTKNTLEQKDSFDYSKIKNCIFSTKTQNSKKSEKKFLCEKCNKLFSTLGNLQNHIMSIHYNYRPFKCSFPNCTKEYSVEAKFVAHLRTHAGVKPFVCQICQKSFNEKGNLKAHLKFHSEIRPFKCPLCNKGYKSSGNLKDHIKFHHYQIKKFSCQFCSKKFGRISALKAHILVHTKEKKFKCEFEGCLKCFTEKRNMEKHYASHLKNLNQTVKNVKEKRTYGSKKIQKDFEEKIKVALSQLDNKNIEKVKTEEKNENKTDTSSNKKKKNLPQDNNIKYNNIHYNYTANNSNLGSCLSYVNFFPLMFNVQKNNANNLNKNTEKDGKNCLKDEKNFENNSLIINNINNNYCSNAYINNNYCSNTKINNNNSCSSYSYFVGSNNNINIFIACPQTYYY